MMNNIQDIREEKQKFVDRQDIKSMTMEELTKEMEALEQPSFRAKQIYSWLHEKTVQDFDAMKNLPKTLRRDLAGRYVLFGAKKVQVQESKIDGTRKYLFALADGMVIESVWMKYHHGNSVCISSQVGCRMGCRFCASTIDGLERNLRPSEMLSQIYEIQKDTAERVSNVVIMGSGEPMDNYDHVIRFIRLLSAPGGQNISQRNITLSTCGIVPGIQKLAGENLAVTLALSLHAPNDAVRRELMPIARKYPLKEVLAACREYFLTTGRRVTFEYSIIEGLPGACEFNPGKSDTGKKFCAVRSESRGRV